MRTRWILVPLAIACCALLAPLAFDPPAAPAGQGRTASDGPATGPAAIRLEDEAEARFPVPPSVAVDEPEGASVPPGTPSSLLTLTAAPTGALDPSAFEALEGAKVTFKNRLFRGQTIQGTFDAHGQVAIPGAMAGRWTLVRPDRRWALTPHVRLPRGLYLHLEGAGPWAQELPIEPSQVLHGFVQDHRGEPIADAKVVVTAHYREHHMGMTRDEEAFARTGSDGSFELGGLPADVEHIAVQATGSWSELKLEGDRAREAVASAAPVVLTLPRGQQIQLDLAHRNGDAVDSGRVAIRPRASEDEHVVQRIREPGVAHFEGLAPGTYEVVGFGPWLPDPEDVEPGDTWTLPIGFTVHTRPEEAAPERALVIDAARVEGRVLGIEANADVRVLVSLLKGVPSDQMHGQALLFPELDPVTRTFATILPPGRYRAMAIQTAPIHDATPAIEFEVGGTSVPLTLEFSGVNQILGRAVDRATGQPIPGAKVTLFRGTPAAGWRRAGEISAGVNGRFALRGVGPGTYMLEAAAGDRLSRLTGPIRVDGQQAPSSCVVELQHGGTLVIRNGDRATDPVTRDTIEIRGDGEAPRPVFVNPGDEERTDPLLPGPHVVGYWCNPPAPDLPTAYESLTYHRLTVSVTAGADSPIDLVTPPSARAALSGRLAGGPHGDLLRHVSIHLEQDGRLLARTQTDQWGQFLLRSMALGPAEIVVEQDATRTSVTLSAGHWDIGDVTMPEDD